MRARALCLLLFAQPAWAQPATETPSPGTETAAPDAAPPDAELARAKELFRTGNTFLKSGDYHRALELFLSSRKVRPSYQNTVNAAICFDGLERYDEALELYEAALIEFPKDLTPELREALEPKLKELRERVGSLEVSANVTGTVTVDGRERGKLPLSSPVRVLPGERTVRVIKDGYETFEQRVKIKAKSNLRVDAKLAPLALAGRLRVEAPEATDAELFVDGAALGKLPWEGTLAPGAHVYEVSSGDRGSGPERVMIVQGQTALVRASLKPLTGSVRLVVTPPTAKLTLDDKPIDGGWQGRLTVGRHVLGGAEEGYQRLTRSLDVDATTRGDLALELTVDRTHPRWTKAIPSTLWFEAFGGYALAASLGSQAEACTDIPCTKRGLARGPLVGLRAAYEFPIRVAIELDAGYLALENQVERSPSQPFDGTSISYQLLDELRLSGAVVTAGIGYRQPFTSALGLQAHLHLGAFINGATDTITATATTPDRGGANARVDGSGTKQSSVALLIHPEAQAQFQLGSWRLGFGVGALIVPLSGAKSSNGELFQTGSCPAGATAPLPISCASGTNAVATERLYGPLVAVVPSLSAGYEFR